MELVFAFFQNIIFYILYNLHFVCLGPTPENIFDVGHKVIDAIEEGVQTGSNAVHGIINDIEDQTGQNDLLMFTFIYNAGEYFRGM